MSYSIEIKKPAEDKLKSFNKDIQIHFAKKIRKLENTPELFGKPLRNQLSGYWELYFEHRFRVLYTINIKNKTVYIEAIKHKDEF